MVVGLVERHGKVILEIRQDRSRETLHKFILEHVDPTVTTVYTDDWPAYRGLPLHDTVNHSAEEWVRGNVHTNTVESIWSLLKRSIVGSYHHVSVKHLDLYLNELSWKVSHRGYPWLWTNTLRRLLSAEHLSYDELTRL